MTAEDERARDEATRGLLGRVTRKRQEMEGRLFDWSFRRHIIWRWLLPYEAGKHDGRIEALRSLEADLLEDMALPKDDFAAIFERLTRPGDHITPGGDHAKN